MKPALAFVGGLLLGALSLAPVAFRPATHVINLDQIPYLEYQWTVIELEEIAHYRQFWTKDELRNLVKQVKAASDAQTHQQVDTPASWPLQPSRIVSIAQGFPQGTVEHGRVIDQPILNGVPLEHVRALVELVDINGNPASVSILLDGLGRVICSPER